ncbi:MAG: hypothetical protein AAB425_14150, partial [Bdellovibrionota bacterium]
AFVDQVPAHFDDLVARLLDGGDAETDFPDEEVRSFSANWIQTQLAAIDQNLGGALLAKPLVYGLMHTHLAQLDDDELFAFGRPLAMLWTSERQVLSSGENLQRAMTALQKLRTDFTPSQHGHVTNSVIYALANGARRLGELDRAITLYEELFYEHPENPNLQGAAFYFIGKTHFEAEHWQLAVDWLEPQANLNSHEKEEIRRMLVIAREKLKLP